MAIGKIEPKFFTTTAKPTPQQILTVKEAQDFFEEEYGEALGEFTNGVSKNGTVGGIAKFKDGEKYKALGYANRPDGATTTTFYYPTMVYYLPSSPKIKTVDKFYNFPNGNSSMMRSTAEYHRRSDNLDAPTSVKKTFYELDGTKRGSILKETLPNGNKLRIVEYPSGAVSKRITNKNGDIIEYSMKNAISD